METVGVELVGCAGGSLCGGTWGILAEGGSGRRGRYWGRAATRGPEPKATPALGTY